MLLAGPHGRMIVHYLSRHGADAMNVGLTRKEQGEQVTPSLQARLDCRNGMASTVIKVVIAPEFV